jgi:pyoverdine/dityrosine biosynthesis protein Dit1
MFVESNLTGLSSTQCNNQYPTKKILTKIAQFTENNKNIKAILATMSLYFRQTTFILEAKPTATNRSISQ